MWRARAPAATPSAAADSSKTIEATRTAADPPAVAAPSSRPRNEIPGAGCSRLRRPAPAVAWVSFAPERTPRIAPAGLTREDPLCARCAATGGPSSRVVPATITRLVATDTPSDVASAELMEDTADPVWRDRVDRATVIW